jgi:hypothetical protein
MKMSLLIGSTALVIIMAFCVTGLLHRLYDDNLAQCIGLIMVSLWALAQLLRAVRADHMAVDDVWLCIALVCFGTGTAVRTWLYRRKGRS